VALWPGQGQAAASFRLAQRTLDAVRAPIRSRKVGCDGSPHSTLQTRRRREYGLAVLHFLDIVPILPYRYCPAWFMQEDGGLRNYNRSCWAHIVRARTLMKDARRGLNR